MRMKCLYVSCSNIISIEVRKSGGYLKGLRTEDYRTPYA